MKNKEEEGLYYYMKLSREFEERISSMNKQGKITGGVYSGIGQEAIGVGMCYGLRKEDFVSPLHRDLSVFLVKGVEPKILLAQIMGKVAGLSKGKDSFLHAGEPALNLFGSTSMLASNLPVATGAALKFKMKGEDNIAVAFFGEGASSRGDFHEALNFAGIHKLPILYVCENNYYAYSTPQHLQMAIDDVAIRAEGYGFKGIIHSGNDLLAVRRVAKKAIARARNGEGPTLIELKTYRYHGHSEHDMALYREEDELLEWESRDPIVRYEMFLEKKGYEMESYRKEVSQRVKTALDEAVDFANNSPYPESESALEHLFA